MNTEDVFKLIGRLVLEHHLQVEALQKQIAELQAKLGAQSEE